MSDTLYERAALGPFHESQPTPAQYVRETVIMVCGYLEENESDPDSNESSFDLITGWAKINRFKPEFLQEKEIAGKVAKIDGYVRRHKDVLCPLAASFPDPGAWSDDAQLALFHFDSGNMGSPWEEEYLWRATFNELDNMELLEYALMELGFEDPSYSEELKPCIEWFSQNIGPFLAIEGYGRTAAAAIRPDLVECSPELALTAEKFVLLLDEIEEAASVLGFEHVDDRVGQSIVDVMEAIYHQIPILERIQAELAALGEAVRKSLFHRPLIPDYVPVVGHASQETIDGPLYEWHSIKDNEDWSVIVRFPHENKASDETTILMTVFDMAEAHSVVFCGLVQELEPDPEHPENIKKATFNLGDIREAFADYHNPTIAVIEHNSTIHFGKIITK